MQSMIPNYGGTFTPGIGGSVSVIGIPVFDASTLAQIVMKRVKEQIYGESRNEIEKQTSVAIGDNGVKKIEAINNDSTNVMVRVNKALEDQNNIEAVQNAMPSIDACRDIALSLSMKSGDIACEMMNDLRHSYLGREASTATNALMTIAKGLNSSFSTTEAVKNQRVNRIIKRYESDIKSDKPVGYYSADRFISDVTSTYDKEQLADLPDFIYIQMRPYSISAKEETEINLNDKALNEQLVRKQLDKSFVADVFASTLMEKVPGEAGVSPLESMREFAKGKTSTEYTQKLQTSKDINTSQIKREQLVMAAFQAHKKLKAYELALKDEQVAARHLVGRLEQNLSSHE
ncbi:hypothetical protein ACI2KR_07275 [Pseudomonas luteola]